ncbi:MAG: sigma-54-dependent Fis family transcriptional regulator, partial [Nitrospira sp.]|nr:sigma-54-dependent Fis family transcriptional regulator [Nitrospira sp.]MCB9711549.1 sigma-54-dependent Fis family transcriptional regulator [Nitrospiraceae bacterium]MDR4487338.1 sigma-54 dependent transcriptional regulator [Nitrospirales bacterium]MCA9468273.1 sigma-54-dependent Fis family transcriptional regulator [Nitrospira sp.]MCA9475503.1 sigma-54-dependent Fis family transcriptional regulator [Nitrospira sp.]
MKKKILIVDDHPDIVLMLTDRLEALGYDTVSAADGKEALQQWEREAPNLMLLDLEMPQMNGMEVLHQLASTGRRETFDPASQSAQGFSESLPLPVIVMTAHGTISKAVEAMRAGAYDFLTKPIELDHLTLVLNKVLTREALTRQVASLRGEVESRYAKIVGESPQVRSMVELAKRAADSDAMVLLLGESGTGKELFARSIHRWSSRRDMPFSIINCVALNESLLENELFGHEKGAFTGADSLQKGKIEAADGGTVFLDEIGDMPIGLQAKLLRVLQDHEFPRVGGTRLIRVNIRVIAATNKDLKQAVRAGTFREDLFFRLNVVNLSLPPLRDRPEDIIPLAEYFLDRHVREMNKRSRKFSKKALETIRCYTWPGNIRELDNAIARAVVLGVDEEISPDLLGMGGSKDDLQEIDNLPYHDALERFSSLVLEKAMRRSNWSQTKAAELLGLQRTYLARLLKQKNIQQGTE